MNLQRGTQSLGLDLRYDMIRYIKNMIYIQYFFKTMYYIVINREQTLIIDKVQFNRNQNISCLLNIFHNKNINLNTNIDTKY